MPRSADAAPSRMYLKTRGQPNLALFKRWFSETEGGTASKVQGIFRNLLEAEERMRVRLSWAAAWARRLAPLPALLAFACLPLAHAEDYPNRFIRVIVGPGPDIVPRLFGCLLIFYRQSRAA